MPDEPDLYALPLEEFTPARDALAKELRAAGERERAAEVKALRKPSQAAWVVNQLARAEPEAIAALLDAGAELRDAQEAALGGKGGVALREAAAAQRAVVEDLVARAGAHRPGGRALSRTTGDRVRALLHAAAANPALAERISAGCLVDDAPANTATGAWGLALEGSGPPRAKVAVRGSGPSRDKGAVEEERARRKALKEARAERSALRKAAESAARACARAGNRVDRAREALARAEAEADAAQAAFDDARSAAAEAEARIAELEAP